MFELELLCGETQIEDLSDALEALDALSVSVEDADAQSAAEEPLYGEPGMPAPRQAWRHSRVLAMFTTEEAARAARDLIVLQDFFADGRVIGIRAVEAQDWVRLTQSQFAPVQITPEFWIVPSWSEAPVQARQIIRLDPGMAFGTGTHPTTHMCLQWIAAHAPRGQRVLDYGCGSGILAIGAEKYGASVIDAVDIDDAAVEAARANVQANGCYGIRTGTPELATGRYDTVLANILATPLRMLAPLLCAHVAPGGHLVLAGILERQEDELKEAYRPYAALEVHARQDGWILMTARF